MIGTLMMCSSLHDVMEALDLIARISFCVYLSAKSASTVPNVIKSYQIIGRDEKNDRKESGLKKHVTITRKLRDRFRE